MQMKLWVQGETKATNYCTAFYEKLPQFHGIDGGVCGGVTVGEISLKR